MFKKILILTLVLIGILGISFGSDINDYITEQIKNASDGDIIILNDGENRIGDTKKNDFQWNIILNSRYTNLSNLNITCKNGKIEKINESNRDEKTLTATKRIDGVGKIQITLKCESVGITSAKKLKATNINYQNIQESPGGLGAWSKPFPVTKNKSKIEISDIDEFKPKKNIDNQPSFIDVIYLQLQVIGDITESIETTNENFDFESLFASNDDFNNYNAWLDKFDNYTTKQEFIDAASGAVTLKDIGVANYVINGLYDCANNNNCNGIIDFGGVNPVNKYENYTLKDIDNLVYKNTTNTIQEAITYYNNLSSSCNNISSISDTFLRTQTQKICNKLISSNLDNTNETEFENYNLGYGLGQRIENLKTIKDNIPEDGINLLGIYNIYYELTNLNLGTNKLSNIKKATETTNANKQYEAIRKIFQKEKKIIKEDKKMDDEDGKKIIKREFLERILTTENNVYKILKNNRYLDLYEDIDIIQIDGNNIIVLNGTKVLGQNIADITRLGEGKEKKTDSKSFIINLGKDYAGRNIELSFTVGTSEPGGECVGLHYYKHNWELCSNREYGDYIKIYGNNKQIGDTICHNGDYSKDYKRKIELDEQGKVEIKFETYTTAPGEIANITNIKYEIVNE